MTRSLHEIIDTAHVHDAIELNRLSEELKATAEQITLEHNARPEDIEDLREAEQLLSKHLGHIALSELVEMMDAAVASKDHGLSKVALDALHKRFPEVPSNPGLSRTNQRSISDYELAFELAATNGTLVSEQIAVAAAKNDRAQGLNFDDVIMLSNWTVLEHRGKIDELTQDGLDELRRHEYGRLEPIRRREERLRLQSMRVIDDDEFDDAEPYNPAAEEDSAA